MRIPLLLALAPLATALASGPVRAEPPPDVAVRLEYVRGPGAASCAGEDVLRSYLMAQFGYDPVKPDASSVLTVAVRGQGGKLSGEVTVVDKDGNVLWKEAVSESDCQDWLRAAAFSVRVGIKPPRRPAAPAAPPKDPPAPESPPAEPPAAKPPAPPARPPAAIPPRRPLVPIPPAQNEKSPRILPKLEVGVGITFAPILMPSVSLGATASVAAGYSNVSLGLEFGGLASLSGTVEGAPIRTFLFTAGLVPCLYARRFFFGCAVLEIGRFSFDADPRSDLQVSNPFIVGFGPRGGVVFPLVGSFSLRTQADVIPLFTRPPLQGTDAIGQGNARGIWTVPPVAVILHVAASAVF